MCHYFRKYGILKAEVEKGGKDEAAVMQVLREDTVSNNIRLFIGEATTTF